MGTAGLMKPRTTALIFCLAATCGLGYESMAAPARRKKRSRPVKWISFPNESLVVSGLPWLKENLPRLWRLPASSADVLPAAVRGLMRYPDGGRIRFASNTSHLRIRVTAPNVRQMWHMSSIGSSGCDVYVNGAYWASAAVKQEGEQDLGFFGGAHRKPKAICIYLPTFQEIRVVAIGVDPDAEAGSPVGFALPRPLVFYGSSIAQGACTSRPGMTYEAILARRMNLDFVNLGFSGAGKAEPEVVDLVNKLDACCFVFDLGKSYRKQPPEVYGKMLDTARAAHPGTPMICVTPIFSTREFYDASYADLSQFVRRVMREAVKPRMEAGDRDLYLVEGLELLGSEDADAFQEGVHPTDLGFVRIADRLEPLLRRVLSLKVEPRSRD